MLIFIVHGTISLFLLPFSFHVKTLCSFRTIETLCLIHFLIIKYFVFGCIGIIDLVILHNCLIRVPCLWFQIYPFNTLDFLNAPHVTICYFCLGMLCLAPFISLFFPSLLFIPVAIGRNDAIQVSPPPENFSLVFQPPTVELIYFLCVSLAPCVRNCGLVHNHAVLHLLT